MTNNDNLSEEQQKNIDDMIEYATSEKGKEYVIDLSNIEENHKFKAVHTYCDNKPITLAMGSKTYKSRIYWDLDNL